MTARNSRWSSQSRRESPTFRRGQRSPGAACFQNAAPTPRPPAAGNCSCPSGREETCRWPGRRDRSAAVRRNSLRFFQPHDYISVDYATQTGVIVSLRMGRVVERKLEPPNGEPLRIELESFVNSVRTRSAPVVSGEDGLRALELAIRINEAIAARSK